MLPPPPPPTSPPPCVPPIPVPSQARMPVCRNFQKTGECKDIGCQFKHDDEEIRECNMYKLGFCIYGPQCRYKHKKVTGEGALNGSLL